MLALGLIGVAERCCVSRIRDVSGSNFDMDITCSICVSPVLQTDAAVVCQELRYMIGHPVVSYRRHMTFAVDTGSSPKCKTKSKYTDC
jgi:hypothetical protein